MRTSAGERVVRAVARLLPWAYPAPFRRVHAPAFPDAAADRWRRERTAGASSFRATLETIRVLVADTWTGIRLARRRVRDPFPRSPLMFDRLLAALRLAVRGLVRSPLVTLVATVSLAIGIGANTAVFSAANALLFAPPAGVSDPGHLVDICRTTNGDGCDTLSYPTYLDYREHMKTMGDVFASRFEPAPLSLGSADGATVVYAQEVSPNYFSVLGTTPAIGRFFRAIDQHDLSPLREVVLSHAFWRDRLGADPDLVGRALTLSGDRYLVAGVAAQGFEGETIVRPDLWVPLTAGGRRLPTAELLGSRESLWLVMGGRLAPGATLAQARAETAVFVAGLKKTYPEIYGRRGLTVVQTSRMPAAAIGVAPFIGLLMGLVGLVLLVACANLGGLLLARGSTRTREIAVRRALGATRGSLVLMYLIEGVVLFLPGLALAFIAAPVGLSVLERLASQLPIPIDAHLPIDWRVVTFTTTVTIAMALATAFAPAWQATGGVLIPDLKQDSSAPRRQRLRHLFVAAQMAFCLVSIAMAGLLLRAVHHSASVDPGFKISDIDVATIDLGLGTYGEAQAAAATDDLRARLSAIPGVRQVAAACVIPLEGSVMGFGDLRRQGDQGEGASINAGWNLISSNYLSTLRIPIVRGRDFSAADRSKDPRDVIVNEHFAAVAWPNQDPIGRRLEMGDFRPRHEDSVKVLTVVGVAHDAKYEWPAEAPSSFIYVPLGEYPWLRPHFFIERDPALASSTLRTGVRQALSSFDRTLPLIDFIPLRQYADMGMLPQRIAASVAGALGALALVLAAIGLYGLTAFIVASRTREIGVRVALGATRPRILGLIVWQSLRMAMSGATVGLLLAVAAARLLATALDGVTGTDPFALGATGVVVMAVAVAATYLPARRAASLNPIAALRVD